MAISCKMMKEAGIRQSKDERKGFHCLRHSLAARLLSEETPLPVISSILGHRDKDLTKVYLSTDLEHLRGCALGLSGIEITKGGIAMNAPLSGHFAPYIERLIEQKKAIGYPYDTSARILKVFGAFCTTNYPDETILTQRYCHALGEKEAGRTCEWACSPDHPGAAVGKVHE